MNHTMMNVSLHLLPESVIPGLSAILASIVPTPEDLDSSQTLMPSATPWTGHHPVGLEPSPNLDHPAYKQISRRDTTPSAQTIRGTRSPSPSPYSTFHRRPSTSHQMPSFSLIGALEFRQVVASLASQAAGDPLNLHLYQESPLTPYVRGHYPHHHSHILGISASNARSGSMGCRCGERPITRTFASHFP
jgi:hypothetical protein